MKPAIREHLLIPDGFEKCGFARLSRNMECNFCHSQQATVFLSQVFKGQTIKLDLCESCARKLEVTDIQGVAVNELIQKIYQIQEQSRSEVETRCPCCGITLEDWRKLGHLGCGQCYEVFSSEIGEIISDQQKDRMHHGKAPRKLREQWRVSRRGDLKNRLDQALQEEDFETAARLRDELNR